MSVGQYSLKPVKQLMSTGETVTWLVTAQVETVVANPSGQIERGVRVFFRLSNGVQSSVFIPIASYNADDVRAAIQESVERIMSVGGLSGSAASNRST